MIKREKDLNNTQSNDRITKERIPDQAVDFNAEEFYSEHGQAIEDYAGDRGLVFTRGKNWAIDLEKGRVAYDPEQFTGFDCSPAEAMLVTCHEIEHFRDFRRDPASYRRLFSRMRLRRRLQVLYNCLDDIEAYQSVDKRFPSLKQTREKRYREKLFPDTDYRDQPRHLQLAYALLREKMLPRDRITLDPEVRREVERLKNIDDGGTDLVALVSDPEAEPGDRHEIIRDYIEPVYEKFFQEDLSDQKNQPGTDGEAGSAGSPEDYFADNYDVFDDKFPNLIPLDQMLDSLDKEARRRRLEAEKTPEQTAEEQFEKEHGVSVRDIESYRADFRKIEQYIEPLRRIFERIIDTRKEIRRRLKERTDQGVVLDPSLISQAYIDAASGVPDSRTQLKNRKIEYDENKPNNLELTLIFDLSGSMDENRPGGKSYEQRLCGVLAMEALDEFEQELKKGRENNALELQVMTEARGFGSNDEELKTLGDTIDYQTRVRIHRRLSRCDGGSTCDFKSLAAIDKSITEEKHRQIEINNLKKIVFLITDGGCDNVRQAKKEKTALDKVGVITKAVQIGQVSGDDKEKFGHVWKDDGQACKDVSQLVPTVEKLLEEILSDL